MIRLPLILMLCLICGCQTGPRPNAPPVVEASTKETRSDGSAVETKVKATGPENTTRTPTLDLSQKTGLRIGGGEAAEFSDWDIQTLPYTAWIVAGCIFLAAGAAAAFYFKELAVGAALGGIGAALIVLPAVVGIVRLAFAALLGIVVLSGLGYAAWRLGLLKRLIGPEAQTKLLAEDDLAGAAAAAYAWQGGGAAGKLAALEIKAPVEDSS